MVSPMPSPATTPASPTREPSRIVQQMIEECSTVISAGSSLQGTLKLDGGVRIEGKISGEIEAKGAVFIAEGADVDAKVQAGVFVIAGGFKGSATCGERLEILPTGRASAELLTKSLIIHEGAFVDGQIRMSSAAGDAAADESASRNQIRALEALPG